MHTVKWFQVLLFIICTLSNGSKYCYLALIILFNIIHSFAHSLKYFYVSSIITIAIVWMPYVDAN